MKKRFPLWILGLAGILLVIIVPLVLFLPKPAEAIDDPWTGVPEHRWQIARPNMRASRAFKPSLRVYRWARSVASTCIIRISAVACGLATPWRSK